MQTPNVADDSAQLDNFFTKLGEFGQYQKDMVGEYPKRLHISPLVLLKLSKLHGFFQREELRTEVTDHSPIVSRMKFSWGVVAIREDGEEMFLHYE